MGILAFGDVVVVVVWLSTFLSATVVVGTFDFFVTEGATVVVVVVVDVVVVTAATSL
jgi:hypothetical protein